MMGAPGRIALNPALVRSVLAQTHTERDRQILLRFYVCCEDSGHIARALGVSEHRVNRVLRGAQKQFRILKAGRQGAASSAAEHD